MRWTKHLSMAHADKAMAQILEEFGAAAYGVYWLMIEDVAAPMEKEKIDPSATHSWVKWSQICHCSVRVFKSIACRMEEKSLINLISIEDRIEITIPNILKYKDEYSKKSGQTPEQEQIQKESRKRAERESTIPAADAAVIETVPAKVTVIKQSDAIQEWFDSEFWPLYPKKVAKPPALRAARAQAKTEELRTEIINGLKELLPEMSAKDPQYIPNPSTFLTQQRWKDPPTLFHEQKPADKNQIRRDQTLAMTKLLMRVTANDPTRAV